jgi:hypothetical protein
VAGIAWEDSSWGSAWRLELDRAVLLPGTLVGGRVRLTSSGGSEGRGILVTLKAVEHWRHRVTRTDAEGHTTTEVVTSRAEVVREPVQVSGPLRLGPGETFERTFELPVPPLGPASLEAEDAGLDWTVEAKVDVEGGVDTRIERAVVVAQPTALLRAGAVPVGAFALYEQADVAAGGVAGTIQLQPMPLVCGQPFHGRVKINVPGRMRLQEVRAEVRVHVEATVSQGEQQDLVAWQGTLAPSGELSGDVAFDVAGALPDQPLPSIELPHGRTSATFHVVLAVAWSPDTHLVRDVAIASTAEI